MYLNLPGKLEFPCVLDMKKRQCEAQDHPMQSSSFVSNPLSVHHNSPFSKFSMLFQILVEFHVVVKERDEFVVFFIDFVVIIKKIIPNYC
jgi:hypothetical protein